MFLVWTVRVLSSPINGKSHLNLMCWYKKSYRSILLVDVQTARNLKITRIVFKQWGFFQTARTCKYWRYLILLEHCFNEYNNVEPYNFLIPKIGGRQLDARRSIIKRIGVDENQTRTLLNISTTFKTFSLTKFYPVRWLYLYY